MRASVPCGSHGRRSASSCLWLAGWVLVVRCGVCRTVVLPPSLSSALPEDPEHLLSVAECHALGVILPAAFRWKGSGDYVEGEAAEEDQSKDIEWLHIGYAANMPNVLLFEKQPRTVEPVKVVEDHALDVLVTQVTGYRRLHRVWRQEEARVRRAPPSARCLTCHGMPRCFCHMLERFSRQNARVRRDAEDFVSDLLA